MAVGLAEPPAETERLLHRRATLADVPGMVRLLRPPPADVLERLGLSSGTWAGAARLLLAHVGLDRGELWVTTRAGSLVGALICLPPWPTVAGGGLELAGRLAMGAAAPAVLRPIGPAGQLDDHWRLLPAVAPDLGALLAPVLRRVDRAGQPVLALSYPGDDGVLAAAGFTRHDRDSDLLVRPAVTAARAEAVRAW